MIRTLGRFGIASAALGTAGAALRFACSTAEPDKVALSKAEWRAFTLADVKDLTPDTKLYRFDLPPEHRLGMTVASCLTVKAHIDGEDVIRPYTPVSREADGHLDLVVKAYPKPNGKMGRHMTAMRAGDTLDMKGPWEKIRVESNKWNKLGMVAGGSGITPMVQVLHALLDDPNDKTEITLLYASRTERDIILRQELDDLARKHPRFKVHYTVSCPEASWAFGRGRVTEATLKQHLPNPSDNCLVMVCGPPGMMEFVCGPKKGKEQGDLQGVLAAMKFSPDKVFKL